MEVQVLIIVLLIVPPILVSALKRTKAFWVPGVGVIALGIVCFATMPDTHDDIGGMAALAAGVAMLAGIVLVGYGFICVLVGAWLHKRALRPPVAPALPTATAVAGVGPETAADRQPLR